MADIATPDAVSERLQALAQFEPVPFPVISLYLDAQADQHGRDAYDAFVRKEFPARARTWPQNSAERQSFEKDAERIREYLTQQVERFANGIVIFACWAKDEFFEAMQLETPVGEHRLYVYNQPHLYHLARIDGEHPRYAAVLVDSHVARMFVFGMGHKLAGDSVEREQIQRVKVGGWSQARYQRRADNAYKDHIRDVVARLSQMVEREKIGKIVIGGDGAMITLLQKELPPQLASLVVDAVALPLKSDEQQIFEKTLESIRAHDAADDAGKVARLLDEYRAGGLAVAGAKETLEALTNGQVDELLLSANLERTHSEEEPVDAVIAPEIPYSTGGTESDEPRQALLADLLVTKAGQTSAKVSFIEDPALLESVEGVGAFLRWRA